MLQVLNKCCLKIICWSASFSPETREMHTQTREMLVLSTVAPVYSNESSSEHLSLVELPSSQTFSS